MDDFHPLENYYRTYTYFLKKKFGAPVLRISVDGGFTCPNRDGKKGNAGCIFCHNESFSPVLSSPRSIEEQITHVIRNTAKAERYKGFIAYFQPYSNTYAPVNKLEEIYSRALTMEGCLGLAVGTRPDCVDSQILDFLQTIAKKYFVTVEYGVQSIYNESLAWMNRGHSYEESLEAITMTANRNITVGCHMILGLPGETTEMMLHQADVISRLPINILKIHQLQIIKNAPLAQIYQNAPFPLWNAETYSDFIVEYLAHLRPDLVIQRLFSNALYGEVIAPLWSRKEVTEKILQKMQAKQITQGCRY